MTQRDGDIAYWKQVRARQIADGLTPGYDAADFLVGDFVAVAHDRWHQITKVNKKTVSVVHISASGPLRALHTITAKYHSQRDVTADHTVRYHDITSRMTEAEARERFPELYEDLDADAAPTRPRRRGGKTALDRRRGLLAERWQWEIDGVEYEAVWPYPDRWYDTPPSPIINPGTVQVSAQRRAPGRLHGEQVPLPVNEFPLAGPVRWPEEVHNQVREIVEARTYLPAST